MLKLNELVGIPFENRGRTTKGCDCMGLAIMAHKCFGVDIPDFEVESNNSFDINNIFENQNNSGKWVELTHPESPCIVVFGLESGVKMVTHVGTYIGDNKILHTLNDTYSSVIGMDHPFFSRKILGLYKYE